MNAALGPIYDHDMVVGRSSRALMSAVWPHERRHGHTKAPCQMGDLESPPETADRVDTGLSGRSANGSGAAQLMVLKARDRSRRWTASYRGIIGVLGRVDMLVFDVVLGDAMVTMRKLR